MTGEMGIALKMILNLNDETFYRVNNDWKLML